MERGYSKKMRGAVLWIICLLVLALTGCQGAKKEGEKVQDLEFTVLGEGEIPQEFKDTIAQKGMEAFKLTYSDGQNLYIAVGYGEQPTGGYSISVNELYMTDNSIVIDTELKGPEKGENVGMSKTFPYIVVRTEFSENPVVFQ